MSELPALPAAVRVIERGEVTLLALPPRPGLRGLAAAALVAALVFGSLGAWLHAGPDRSTLVLGLGTAFAVFGVVAFLGALGMGLGSVAFAVGSDHVTVLSRIAGVSVWSTRLPLDRMRSIWAGPAESAAGRRTFAADGHSVLHVMSDGGVSCSVEGYPFSWASPVAARLESLRSERSPRSSGTTADVSASDRLDVRESGDRVILTLKAGGSNPGRRRWVQGGAFILLLVMGLWVGAMVILPPTFERRLSVTLAFFPFWLLGVVLMIASVRMGRSRWVFDLDPQRLLVERAVGSKARRSEWIRSSLLRVECGACEAEPPGLLRPEIRLRLRDGSAASQCYGMDHADLHELARVLNDQIGVA